MWLSFAKRLFANKFLLIATTISLAILFLVLILSSNSRKEPTLPTSTTSTQNPFSEFTNLTEEKVNNAITYRKLIADRLPIYLSDFETSVGINTTISISIHPTEPSITRFDITGLSYLNKNELDPSKNSNLVAFQETYQKALALLRESGIEPKQLLFSYGEADYVRETANLWVDKLGLLR